MELYYVWNLLSMQPGRPVIEEKHRVLAEHVQDYWVNFIKRGDPNGTGLPNWPPCTKENGLHLYIHGDCLKAQGSHYPEGTGLIETLMERAEILHVQYDFPD